MRSLLLACTLAFTSMPFPLYLQANGIEKASSMNFAVSDGRHLVATRCRNHADEPPPSLFYCLGEGCGEACGSAAAGTPDNPIAPGSVAISSEPLTKCPKSW